MFNIAGKDVNFISVISTGLSKWTSSNSHNCSVGYQSHRSRMSGVLNMDLCETYERTVVPHRLRNITTLKSQVLMQISCELCWVSVY